MVPGIVNTNANMILPATPHRIAETLSVKPTPIIAPVMVWVVLTGIPPNVLPITAMARAVSALNRAMNQFECLGLNRINTQLSIINNQ